MNEVQNRWTFDQVISHPMRKFVLLNLAFQAESDEFICPPISEIASDTQLSESEVIGHIKRLKMDGYLKESECIEGGLVFVRSHK